MTRLIVSGEEGEKKLNTMICSGCGTLLTGRQAQSKYTGQWVCSECKQKLSLLGYDSYLDGPLQQGEMKEVPLIGLELYCHEYGWDLRKFPFRERILKAIELAQDTEKIERLKKEKEISKTFDEAYDRAIDLMNQERFEEALKACDEAIRIRNLPGAIECKASILMNLRRFQEAQELYCSLLIHQDPLFLSTVHFNLGRAYRRMGDFDKAIYHFEIAAQNPDILNRKELKKETKYAKKGFKAEKKSWF